MPLCRSLYSVILDKIEQQLEVRIFDIATEIVILKNRIILR